MSLNKKIDPNEQTHAQDTKHQVAHPPKCPSPYFAHISQDIRPKAGHIVLYIGLYQSICAKLIYDMTC